MENKLQKALLPLRNDIDHIDGEILHLLNSRASLAQKIGEIKLAYGEAEIIYRPEREAQVLRRLREMNTGPLENEKIIWLFREIMSACLSLEKTLSIAMLGPLGTFSEIAARRHFGHAAQLLPQASIDDVFREIESGHAHYGVVPIENSSEGAVGRTMDLLLASPLKICSEVFVRIHQNLLSKTDNFNEIKTVYSHAQSLAQCHEWLNKNLTEAARIPVASNALAAQCAAKEVGAAAIASESAATHYDLKILAENIEDDPRNTTRFIVLGKQDAGLSGQDKTSLIMSAPNHTGSLHELLLPFAQAGVSLCKLESRPAANAMWEYVFYVDIEGHWQEKNVKEAIRSLEKIAPFLKLLGSYPKAAY